jgi:fluoride exporter
MSDWLLSLFVFVGGGTGAIARFWIGRWLATSSGFPWATFSINVAGSFLLGVLAILLKDRPGWLVLLGAGFCGGFTTFSTFSLDTLRMLEDQAYWNAGAYAVGSMIAGLIGVWLGGRFSEVVG